MLNRWVNFLKLKSYTLRFSILSVFVTLLIISMASIITLMYLRAINNITIFAFDLMRDVSSDSFREVASEIKRMEIKNKSSAHVLSSGIINLDEKNHNEVIRYIINVLKYERELYPILNSFMWVDSKGNMVYIEKSHDHTFKIYLQYDSKNKKVGEHVYYDTIKNSFKTITAPDMNFNPRLRPWYLETIKNKKTTWFDVYKYRLSNTLGISVVTPIVSKNNSIIGVIKFDARLDFLRKLIESIKFSKNGVIFIVTKTGKLVAFPGLVQYINDAVQDIHQLKNYPWVISAYDNFIRSNNSSFSFDYENKKYLASFTHLMNLGESEWFVGAAVPKDDFVSGLNKTAKISVFMALLILLGSIFIVSNIISRIIKPLKKITFEIDKIKNYDLKETEVIESRIKEISYMASALYSMKNALRAFQKYVPSSLVRDLIEAGEEVKVGGVKKPLAILFTDIYNFTSIAETSDPHLLASRICDYFDVLSKIIIKQNGTIDKYIGDAIMAFWGAPLTVEDPCYKAAKAALLCIRQLTFLNNLWENENKPAFLTSIGINFGEAIVGNFGSSERLSYTALGDAVNLASRLQNINRYFGTNIIVSESVYQAIKNDFVLRMIDCVTVKGRAESTNIYELIGEEGVILDYDIDAYRITFSSGFLAYKNRKWDEALIHFKQCINIYKLDVVGPLFMARCEKFKIEPPPSAWQGVWNLDKNPV